MNPSKPYYFAFETHADHSLTGHCVRIETHHFPPNTFDQKKLELLGKDRETDPRIELLLKHGHANYPANPEPTPEARVEALKFELNQLAKLMNEFPVAELVCAVTDGKRLNTLDLMVENRKKASAVFQEVADDFQRSGRMMEVMRLEIRKLQSLQHNMDLLKDFTDVMERLAAVEKSGFIDRIKPLLQ